MTGTAPAHRARRERGRTARRWSAVVGVLALLTVAALVVVTRYAASPSPVASADPVASAGPSAGPAAPAASTAPAAERPPPVEPAAPAGSAAPAHLWIPKIGVASDLLRLGLNTDDTVEVPSVPAQAGWYDLGPAPGQPGSAVILGHVDSTEGPAVFFRLDELVAGDRLRVRLADGTVERFEVVQVATYANEDFPARRVYAGSPRRATLNLVTCGGDYDPARGGYQSNVVVFTEKVGSRT